MRYSHIQELKKNIKLEYNFFENEKKQDEIGIVLAFILNKKIIGTVRLVPTKNNITLTERLINDYEINHFYLSDSWEIGRLVLVEEHRKYNTLTECLKMTAKWLVQNTDIETIFALCTKLPMIKLYKRFSFRLVANNLKFT